MDQAEALTAHDIEKLSTDQLLNVAVGTCVALEDALEDAQRFNQRQRLVLDELRARLTRGGYSRPAPYGYRHGVNGLEAIPDEQQVIDVARKLRADGRPWESVREALNARGFRTRRRSMWRASDMPFLKKALT